MCKERRELPIRTNVGRRIQRLREILHILYLHAKRRLSGIKPFVLDEESMDDDMDDEPDDDLFEFKGPVFDPAVTAWFSTDYLKPLYPITRRVIRKTRKKVQMDCRTLVDQGYTDFVVNYGVNFGMISLSELIHLKKTQYPQINLYCGKLWGEQSRCHTSLDFMRIVITCVNNGAKFVGSMHMGAFDINVVRRVSRLSCERGLIDISQTLPESILTHFVKYFIRQYCENCTEEIDADP